MKWGRCSGALALLAAAALAAGGCGQGEDRGSQPAGKTQEAAKKVHDHSGWWCDEHGIPEHLCSMCSAKVARECKARGDWCKEHDRAKSQCFKCDPSLREKFAAMYRAKYGKEPPPIEEE